MSPAVGLAGGAFHIEYPVYGYEVSPRGYLRASALVRFAQQAAGEELDALGLRVPGHSWVVRRNVLSGWRGIAWVGGLRLVRRITGVGTCWLEACTDFWEAGRPTGASVRAFWVQLGPDQRPAPVDAAFGDLCRAAGGDGELIWRSRLPRRVDYTGTATVGVREADYDALGHVNNSVYLDLLERLIVDADVVAIEYDSPIDWPTGSAVLRTGARPEGLAFRLESAQGGRAYAHGLVRTTGGTQR